MRPMALTVILSMIVCSIDASNENSVSREANMNKVDLAVDEIFEISNLICTKQNTILLELKNENRSNLPNRDYRIIVGSEATQFRIEPLDDWSVNFILDKNLDLRQYCSNGQSFSLYFQHKIDRLNCKTSNAHEIARLELNNTSFVISNYYHVYFITENKNPKTIQEISDNFDLDVELAIINMPQFESGLTWTCLDSSKKVLIKFISKYSLFKRLSLIQFDDYRITNRGIPILVREKSNLSFSSLCNISQVSVTIDHAQLGRLFSIATNKSLLSNLRFNENVEKLEYLFKHNPYILVYDDEENDNIVDSLKNHKWQFIDSPLDLSRISSFERKTLNISRWNVLVVIIGLLSVLIIFTIGILSCLSKKKKIEPAEPNISYIPAMKKQNEDKLSFLNLKKSRNWTLNIKKLDELNPKNNKTIGKNDKANDLNLESQSNIQNSKLMTKIDDKLNIDDRISRNINKNSKIIPDGRRNTADPKGDHYYFEKQNRYNTFVPRRRARRIQNNATPLKETTIGNKNRITEMNVKKMKMKSKYNRNAPNNYDKKYSRYQEVTKSKYANQMNPRSGMDDRVKSKVESIAQFPHFRQNKDGATKSLALNGKNYGQNPGLADNKVGAINIPKRAKNVIKNDEDLYEEGLPQSMKNKEKPIISKKIKYQNKTSIYGTEEEFEKKPETSKKKLKNVDDGSIYGDLLDIPSAIKPTSANLGYLKENLNGLKVNNNNAPQGYIERDKNRSHYQNANKYNLKANNGIQVPARHDMSPKNQKILKNPNIYTQDATDNRPVRNRHKDVNYGQNLNGYNPNYNKNDNYNRVPKRHEDVNYGQNLNGYNPNYKNNNNNHKQVPNRHEDVNYGQNLNGYNPNYNNNNNNHKQVPNRHKDVNYGQNFNDWNLNYHKKHTSTPNRNTAFGFSQDPRYNYPNRIQNQTENNQSTKKFSLDHKKFGNTDSIVYYNL